MTAEEVARAARGERAFEEAEKMETIGRLREPLATVHRAPHSDLARTHALAQLAASQSEIERVR